MAIIKPTLENKKTIRDNGIRFEPDGAMSKIKTKKSCVEFRLYPIPSYTGACKNGIYYNALQRYVLRWLKKKKALNYKFGYIRECYGRVPEGFNCKYFELPVRFFGSYKLPAKEIWFNELDQTAIETG